MTLHGSACIGYPLVTLLKSFKQYKVTLPAKPPLDVLVCTKSFCCHSLARQVCPHLNVEEYLNKGVQNSNKKSDVLNAFNTCNNHIRARSDMAALAAPLKSMCDRSLFRGRLMGSWEEICHLLTAGL